MKIEYRKDGIIVGDAFLSLSDIIEECNNIKIKEDKLVLLEMGWDGRGGSVSEKRILPLKNALRVKEILLDKEVYFGEIWGKHSEVYGEMTEDTFEIVKDKKKIKDFLKDYPSGVEYDYSFIYSFIERAEEKLDYEKEDLDENDITQEGIDELYGLLNY